MRNKSLIFKLSILFLALIFFIGIFSGFISNNRPILCSVEGKTYWPIFNDNPEIQYKNLDYDFSIWPLVPFSANDMDLTNTRSSSPGSIDRSSKHEFVHILGTDHLGRDVSAGLINGAKVTSIIVSGTILTTIVLGIFLGLIMGYYGDLQRMNRNAFIIGFYIFLILIIHFKFLNTLNAWLSVLIWTLPTFSFWWLSRKSKNNKIKLPFDLILSRIIEVFNSIPTLLFLIAIFSGLVPSLSKIIILISLISWPGVASLVRAETLAEKNKEYVIAMRTLNFSSLRIIFMHILPNIKSSLIVYISFLAGSIILVESSLSFLGLGVPPDIVTWGKMLSLAKSQLSAWWLVLFPGFFIFACVFAFNIIGQELDSAKTKYL